MLDVPRFVTTAAEYAKYLQNGEWGRLTIPSDLSALRQLLDGCENDDSMLTIGERQVAVGFWNGTVAGASGSYVQEKLVTPVIEDPSFPNAYQDISFLFSAVHSTFSPLLASKTKQTRVLHDYGGTYAQASGLNLI